MAGHIPLWQRAAGPLRRQAARFPFERALVMGVAAVIGLYGGIAAGLFANAIRFVQLVVFRGNEVAWSLLGPDRARWGRLFRARLGAAHWHLEFLAMAGLLLVAAPVLEAFGRKRFPLFELHRIRAVALAAALGLALYYPLLLLGTFNGTFHETAGGLYAMLVRAPWWTWVAGPALGALLAALIVRVSPESGGHGVVEVIEAVHKPGAPIKGRVALWKSLAAGLVIGSGGSAGREGPVVHLGGAVASSLSRFLALPRSETSMLLAAGAGAGIAASFQAPLAGCLFALEIVLADFDVRRFAPVVLACVTAVATSRALLGGGTELRAVAWSLTHPSEIAVYLALGVVAGLCALIYIRVVHGMEAQLARLPLRPELRAALGGLLVGCIGLLAPRILGTGIETMNAALAGRLAFGALVLALGCKLIATSFTLGSGSPGGSFFPAVFIGAMLGGAFGQLAHSALPGIASSPGAYAAVGMGAVVAGATLAPLTGVLMMFELTGSYQIVLPLLVACGIAAALVQGALGGSIYTIGARRRGVRLSRGGPALADLSVAQALDRVESLPADLPYEDLLGIIAPTRHAAFPLLEGDVLAGIVSVRETRSALLDPAVDRTATARVFARPAQTLFADDDLGTAVERLSSAGVAEAVVVDADGKPLGVVSREGILEAWRRATTPG
ncbi:MAG TPA: chloride channel protein [Myxococcales bacterium]|jgi:CIC family chloride channel protein|nr:chloride channel protein [Myxococcales bacterium]